MAGNDDRRERPTQQGPRRQEMIDEQERRRAKESLGEAADYQVQPRNETPERARVTETGTAERSQEAAGVTDEEHHYESSERAFRQSRGDRRPRE